MLKNKIQILSTRPVGAALIREAADNDIIIDEISFIKTEEIVDAEIENKIRKLSSQNITAVFTSMNAVNAVAKFITNQPPWKIFCIGNTTKESVKKFFGKETINGFADNADQLSKKIIENPSIRNITFFCGDKRRNELPGSFIKNGIDLDEITVYKTVETQRTLTKQYDGILFFSPSAVQSFFSKNSISEKTKVFAIGTTTANVVKLFVEHPVIIADISRKENLVKLAINHFSKSNIL